MKIRNGFVSNSSSSSFAVFGIETNILNITPKMLGEKNYTVIGSSLEGGSDVFQLDEKSLAFVKACHNIYGRSSPFTVYEDLGEGRIDLSKLPKEGFAEIINGEMDQNSSYDLETLFENYCSDYSEDELDADRIKLEMQKFLRKDKIDEIEKSI